MSLNPLPESLGLVLVVEDDPRVARFLVRGLREEGYTVDLCEDGESALQSALSQPYDLVLLDWSLPARDGVNVLRRLRAEAVATPVIMLTARSGVDATVLALDAGADDYVTKPFRFEELLARIRASLRRAPEGGEAASVTLGEATFDRKARTIARRGEVVSLSTREHELLDYLVQRRGEVVTRARLLDRVWRLSHDPTTNVVDVYIRYLRAKLDGPDTPARDSIIETVRGQGYRLRGIS